MDDVIVYQKQKAIFEKLKYWFSNLENGDHHPKSYELVCQFYWLSQINSAT
jgi:hypothetical protein